MCDTNRIQARLRHAAALPDTLAASFDAFEIIRQAARSCEDRIPALFAAFMTAADAAVDGREAILAAPSLPAPDRADAQIREPGTDADPWQVIGDLAALSALLHDCLLRAATLAAVPDDRAACQDAAQAAARIRQLMGRGDDDAGLR